MSPFEIVFSCMPRMRLWKRMVSATFDVTKADVDEPRSLSAQCEGLSSRDCLHVTVMRRAAIDTVWSYDEAYDIVPSIIRIQ